MIAENGEAFMVYQDKAWKDRNIGKELKDKIYHYEIQHPQEKNRGLPGINSSS